MDPRLEANRSNCDDRVAIHTRSRFYDVNGWLDSSPGPSPEEIEALGDVTGLDIIHLQCHFGMDTMNWARAGANVTGVDFSPAAVKAAIELAERAGLAERSTFICSDVYDAPNAVAGQHFDIVYVSLGALCWLPDVASWGSVVARLLGPGGRLYIHDVHPFAAAFDDGGDQVEFSYFEETDRPMVFDQDTTYTDGAKLSSTTTYEWNHSLGEIVSSLLRNGLVLDSLLEHDWTVFQQFPWLIEGAGGRRVIPAGRPRIPLTFTMLAHRPN
jgi:SAM-dependent methyltransferase